MAKLIIITDLDGSLLDAVTYSFEAALPALKAISEKGIPLVLCSSKTRSEIEVYRKRLANSHPFICENGGGIFIPKGYFRNGDWTASAAVYSDEYETIAVGKTYNEIRRTFIELREESKVSVKGFGDMTAREVAAISGLPEEEAVLAKQRDFGEPFVFEEDPPDENFLKAIKKSGLHWTQGRFFHIMGENDKGKAVKILKHLYEKMCGEVFTVGLGDGFNDLPMLKEVDFPVLIPKEDGMCDPRVKLPNLSRARDSGPSGWNEAILGVLQRGSALKVKVDSI